MPDTSPLREPTEDDADGLRDLADRSRRAARTASHTAAASADAELRAMLADLASQLEVSATLAENIAGRIEAGTR